MLNDNTIMSVCPDQMSSRLGNEMAILDMRSGIYFGLNSVAARVWELIQNGKTIGAIRAALLNEFDVNSTALDQDLHELFEAMLAQGLVSPTSDA